MMAAIQDSPLADAHRRRRRTQPINTAIVDAPAPEGDHYDVVDDTLDAEGVPVWIVHCEVGGYVATIYPYTRTVLWHGGDGDHSELRENLSGVCEIKEEL